MPLLNSLFLVYRNAIGLCMLILYSVTSLNSLISSNNFGRDVGGVFRVFYKEDHVICKQKKNLLIPFPFGSLLFHPVVLTGTASTMLYKSGKSWHPCHVLILKESPPVFTTEYDVLMGISYIVFILLR